MVTKGYTPILKWKAAERNALCELTDIQKNKITPMLEFIRPILLSSTAKKKGISSPEDELLLLHSTSIPHNILTSWGDGRPFLSDLTLIAPDNLKIKFAKKFYENTSKLHLEAIPVFNLSDSQDYIETILNLSKLYAFSKIGIRINSAQIFDINHIDNALNEINNRGFPYQDITLILDLKDDTSPTNFHNSVVKLEQIKSLQELEEVIIASGAFPKDMSKYSKDDENNYQSRDDWLNWKGLKQQNLKRLPSFADYTIRHPIYDEEAMKHRSTATIKYTLSDRWHILKGEVGNFSNCLAYAHVLKDLNEFYGKNFSAGDRYIEEKGNYFTIYMQEQIKNPQKKISGTGNAQLWIQAGINHHIATVVDQLSNLTDEKVYP